MDPTASTSTLPLPLPSHHANLTRNAFRNPWPSASKPTWTELASASFPLGWSDIRLRDHIHAKKVKLVKPTWGIESNEGFKLKGTWLGHASAFVELPLVYIENEKRSVKILFDPIFSSVAGPTAYTGPGRLIQAPCQVQDLPGVDIVCISHNHYDHLDYPTILSLNSQFPFSKFFIPLGLKSFLLQSGIEESRIFELDWWEKVDFNFSQLGFDSEPSLDSGKVMSITAVPAQHNSGRRANDQSSTLWCGWVIEGFESSTGASTVEEGKRRGSIYFAGDTGYRRYSTSSEICPAFVQIGETLGPFDLSFIPIWRGGTLSFFSYFGLRLAHETLFSAFHCSPVDSIQIHKEVKSKNSVAIHFGTFIGNELESLEAVIELMEGLSEEGIKGLEEDEEEEAKGGRMGVINMGETLCLDI